MDEGRAGDRANPNSLGGTSQLAPPMVTVFVQPLTNQLAECTSNTNGYVELVPSISPLPLFQSFTNQQPTQPYFFDSSNTPFSPLIHLPPPQQPHYNAAQQNTTLPSQKLFPGAACSIADPTEADEDYMYQRDEECGVWPKEQKKSKGKPSKGIVRKRLISLLPERKLRTIFVLFGIVLCVILMIDGAAYMTFSSFAGDKSGSPLRCPLNAHTFFQLKGHTSDEAGSLGKMAGGMGLAVAILFCLFFMFTLLVDALSIGKLQLFFSLSMTACCICMVTLFLVSWVFLYRDITTTEMYIKATYHNAQQRPLPPSQPHQPVPSEPMSKPPEGEEDDKERGDKEDDDDDDEDEKLRKLCGVPPSWTASSILGLFGAGGWFGTAVWILIWLVTTRSAARMHQQH